MTPELVHLLEDPARVAELPAEKIPAVLGELEQLKAIVWARMMGGSGPAEAAAEARPPKELSPRELGVRLGLRPRSVHELLRTNQLPGYKVGRLWRVDEADFQAWVESQKRGVDKAGITMIPSRYDETRSPARQKGSRALAIEFRRAPGRAQVDGPSVGSGALPRKRSRRAPHPVAGQAAEGPGEA